MVVLFYCFMAVWIFVENSSSLNNPKYKLKTKNNTRFH